MKKLDYDKFLNANKTLGVLCRTQKEIYDFAEQMDSRCRLANWNLSYKTVAEYYTTDVVFLNNGNFGSLDNWENRLDVYDFTTGELVTWKRGTKRPNNYLLHKDVVDYSDYVFENQLYRVIYYKTYPYYSKFAEYSSYIVEGYIDNFNPADKIAIRDKNNLLYCIDYKLITLIEPIKEDKK